MNTSKRRGAIIVGTGAIADAHGSFYRESDRHSENGPVLDAVVDVDAKRARAFAEKHGVSRVFTDFDEAVDRVRPSLVHICTPPWLHAEQTISALKSGAWVICEKPAAGSLAEIDRIEEAEKGSGCFAPTVFQWRFGSGMAHLKKQIEEKTPGRPLVALCNTLWFRDDEYYAVPWRGKWATELGGPTVIHGIHLMDSLLWLLGEWETVTALTATLERTIETEDVSAALVRFKNGVIATIANSVLSPRQETHLRIDFSKATVEVSGLYAVTHDQWRWTVNPALPAEEQAALEEVTALPEVEISPSQETQIRCLYDDMKTGTPPLTTGRERRRTVEFLTCLYKSAATGRSVTAGSITADDPWYHSFCPVP